MTENIPRRRRARSWTTPAALLATSAVLALAACGGPAAPASSSSTGGSTGSTSGVVNITWQTMWSGNTLTLLNQMVTEFNNTHPNIHVTESNIPSATGDAKLLSEIAAGDPPDVFTEWNPVLGEYAARRHHPAADPVPDRRRTRAWRSGSTRSRCRAGEYKGTLYALPMSMNSWALYYNKSMLKAAGISAPPTTLAQLYADPPRSGRSRATRSSQIGFYPNYNQGFEYFGSFFNAVNCFNSAGQYDFAQLPGRAGRGELLRAVRQLPVLGHRRHGDRVRRGRGRRRRRVRRGQGRVRHGRALGGRPEHPGHEPGHGRQLRRRWRSPGPWPGRARSGRATTTSSPRAPPTRRPRSRSSPGWPATTTRPSPRRSTRRAAGCPHRPRSWRSPRTRPGSRPTRG